MLTGDADLLDNLLWNTFSTAGQILCTYSDTTFSWGSQIWDSQIWTADAYCAPTVKRHTSTFQSACSRIPPTNLLPIYYTWTGKLHGCC